MKSLSWILALSLLGGGIALRGQQSESGTPSGTSTAPPPVPWRVRVSAGVASGLVVKKVPPHYPEEARRQHIQGTVILQAKISKEGDVAELSVISGDPMLVEEAMKAVKKWKYKPYLLQGRAMEVETQIQVNFTLVGG